MAELDFSLQAQHWVNLVLIWVGFGTIAGLSARALVPGRDPAGAIGVVVLGIAGSTLGPLVLTLLLRRGNFNPLSPPGFLAAVAGAFVLLLAYRLFVAFSPVPETAEAADEVDEVDEEEEDEGEYEDEEYEDADEE